MSEDGRDEWSPPSGGQKVMAPWLGTYLGRRIWTSREKTGWHSGWWEQEKQRHRAWNEPPSPSPGSSGCLKTHSPSKGKASHPVTSALWITENNLMPVAQVTFRRFRISNGVPLSSPTTLPIPSIFFPSETPTLASFTEQIFMELSLMPGLHRCKGTTDPGQVPLASHRGHHKCANNQDPRRDGGMSANRKRRERE